VNVFAVLAGMEFQVFGVNFHDDSIIAIRGPSRGGRKDEPPAVFGPSREIPSGTIGAIMGACEWSGLCSAEAKFDRQLGKEKT
jgi:hypothetical protein